MTYGVSPVQLGRRLCPFGNGGVFNSPHFITKVTDASGRVLYQHRSEGERGTLEQSAFLMTSLLQSVTSSGTGAKLSAAGTPVAARNRHRQHDRRRQPRYLDGRLQHRDYLRLLDGI